WVMLYATRKGVSPGNLGWAGMGHPIALQKDRKPYPGAAAGDPDLDSFFMLGDNSPSSLDSRAWVEASPTLRLFAPGTRDENDPANQLYQLGTVPRYNMIGKALFVYWPSGHRLPGLPGLPIVPNVGRMRFVR
ncbi:MAG: S26 family signal peptidase, partial [Planctomycetota bacterium]|nr:S26 family signal peptidase [Planctomycetota bacterium]